MGIGGERTASDDYIIISDPDMMSKITGSKNVLV